MSQNISTTRGAPAIKKRNFAGDEPISILFLDLLLLLLLLLGIKRQGRRYSNSIHYVAECYCSERSYKKSMADASSGLQLFRKETQNHAAIFNTGAGGGKKHSQGRFFRRVSSLVLGCLVYFKFFSQQRPLPSPHPPWLLRGAVGIFVARRPGPFASRRKKESSSLFDEPYLGFFSPSRTQLFVYGVTFCCNLLYEKYRMLW